MGKHAAWSIRIDAPLPPRGRERLLLLLLLVLVVVLSMKLGTLLDMVVWLPSDCGG
jgi:hypothetical protein